MRIRPFHLERYFSRHEFTARHLLCSSDCEALALAEVLALADDECQELWRGLRLSYTESLGLPLLRREIAALYTGVTPDDVLVVVPEEGILLAMTVLLEPGDHVIVTFPGYASLYGLAEMMGCEVTRWTPREEEGWRFDPEFVRRALRPTTRLVVVNFPHNPTGFLPTHEEWAALLEIVEDAGLPFFSDEMYRWLEPQPAMRLPSACERSPRAVTLCGMSKTFSMPGLRLGWLATRDAVLRARLAAAKDYSTICSSAPSEILALIGLRRRAAIIARNVAQVAANQAAWEAFTARCPGELSWSPPRAGSVGLARLAAPGGAADFCERLAAEAGVMLLPSTVYDYGDAHVRVGLGRASFAEGLRVLEGWLSSGLRAK